MPPPQFVLVFVLVLVIGRFWLPTRKPGIEHQHEHEHEYEKSSTAKLAFTVRATTLARMLILIVHIQVKPECVEAFKAATLDNARNSVREAGVARFDVVQQQDDPTRFVLYEAYRTADAPAQHKETAHYKHWAAVTADMFVTPRTRALYQDVHWT